MPYIENTNKNPRRDILDPRLREVVYKLMELPNDTVKGDLNYVFTYLASEFILIKGLSYQNISDARDALIGAANEIHDRIIRPYEDFAIDKNGDVKPLDSVIELIEEKINARKPKKGVQ